MGNNNSSQLEKELGNDFPEGEHFVGFENAIYYCQSLKENVISYQCPSGIPKNGNAIIYLQEIFQQIQSHKKKVAILSTKKFMNYVRSKNEMFQGDYHQDTQEFLIWFLNEINELLCKAIGRNPNVTQKDFKEMTWLEKIFEGTFTTSTRCLTCQNVTATTEPFLDLSIDVEQNTSLTHCLRNFSQVELLNENNKFFCDKCNHLVDAEKKVAITKLPNTLIIHFKRFKFDERQQRMVKLNSRVAFPFEIRIETELKEGGITGTYYNLFGMVVHLGQGFQYGHYFSIIKIRERWYQFDDDTINPIDENVISVVFGGNQTSSLCAYLLFYQRSDRSEPELDKKLSMLYEIKKQKEQEKLQQKLHQEKEKEKEKQQEQGIKGMQNQNLQNKIEQNLKVKVNGKKNEEADNQ